jgi:hypothetical protein
MCNMCWLKERRLSHELISAEKSLMNGFLEKDWRTFYPVKSELLARFWW